MERPLFLNGFMATGKSTIGRRVAEAARVPFVDLDKKIEARAGKAIARIFADDGEGAFRRLERDAVLAEVSDPRPRVVAFGGGALVPRDLRLRAMDRGLVVLLEASVETLVERAGRSDRRPLLAGDDAGQRARRLLEERRPAYDEAAYRVSTDALGIDGAASRVLTLWRRNPLGVAAGAASYAVEVGDGIGPERVGELVHGASRVLLLTDDNVDPLHGETLREALDATGLVHGTHVQPAGEEHKAIRTMERIWRAALEFEADRKSVFVGLGGGVVTDMTGFAAATWMRGTRWVGLPTTLLAMVDASVGGKTAVDLPGAKNCVGAFWQPSAVVCDVSYLRTEAERNYRSALSEVVKTALIGDPELFELLEREADAILARDAALAAEIVRRSIRVKARIVSEDERESGRRATLNLGHTIGHALESEAGFTGLTHGEAISLGLVAALLVGEKLGHTPAALTSRTVALLERLQLPTVLQRAKLERATALIGHDKKRAGRELKFIVARDLGTVELVTLGLHEVEAMARELAPS